MADDESANGEESEPEGADADEEAESDGRELEYEHYHGREEVVTYLESFLEGFSAGDTVTLTIGDETIDLEPPEHMNFEVEYEEEGDMRELEFELEWEERTEDLEIGSS